MLIVSSAWFFSECYIFLLVWLLFHLRPLSNHFGGMNELEVDSRGRGCSFSSYIFNLHSNAKNSALFLSKKEAFSYDRRHRNHKYCFSSTCYRIPLSLINFLPKTYIRNTQEQIFGAFLKDQAKLLNNKYNLHSMLNEDRRKELRHEVGL